ncbi:MAG: NAD-dependent epimerase/dehydratase family protein [Acidobacteria bacterium]|nr:NAD-dependent epimerase/dehydratase family protein [Acidobacteriota bacterium]
MKKKVLITGGAGFIGSHVADELLTSGYGVRVIDTLLPQVHGATGKQPDYLNSDVEFWNGDVRDPCVLRRALHGVDAVFHFAANVGVGQSMYKIVDYCSANDIGTAVLLECLIERPVERLVVASSMSIYGEGLYRDASGQTYEKVERTLEQLKQADWEARSAEGEALVPLPTPEWKSPSLKSVYALGKYTQERMCLMVGEAYNIPTVALRFFNVYGPRQALSNPYTGVLAIFASRLLNGNAPIIYEDGQQKRDFVSVYDIAKACGLALETPEAAGRAFNIGSGKAFTVLEIASLEAKILHRNIFPLISRKYRMGDIRNCFADIGLARKVLGFEPTIELEQGLADLAEWLDGQAATDRVAEAGQELAVRGLTM